MFDYKKKKEIEVFDVYKFQVGKAYHVRIRGMNGYAFDGVLLRAEESCLTFVSLDIGVYAHNVENDLDMISI